MVEGERLMNSIDWSKGHILYIANEVPKGKNLPDEKWAGLVHTVNAGTRLS
jgi:hypothetical protein